MALEAVRRVHLTDFVVHVIVLARAQIRLTPLHLATSDLGVGR